jgi:polyisoprenoid-binding protein YceI
VEWTGRNINNRHYGRIAFSAGEIVISNALPVSGRFELDMESMTNLDLQDEGWRGMLQRHLKSEDFFDVQRFPTSTFEVRGAAPIAGATPGTPNMELAGSLTIKGTTRPICFPAMVAAQEDGTLKAQAALDLDRTLWNVSYGSGRLFERLGMHLVNDLISIELFIVTQKAA